MASRGPSDSGGTAINALDVLEVTERPDGSLWVALPCPPSPSAATAGGKNGGDPGAEQRPSTASATAGREDGAMTTIIPEPSPHETPPSWVKDCGLEGYDH